MDRLKSGNFYLQKEFSGMMEVRKGFRWFKVFFFRDDISLGTRRVFALKGYRRNVSKKSIVICRKKKSKQTSRYKEQLQSGYNSIPLKVVDARDNNL